MRPAKARKRASVVDVAQRAGVSQATVSRVFDPKWAGRIRPETRRLVEEAAAALDYRGANPLARSLQGGPSGMVALVADAASCFDQELTMKLIRRLHAAGQQVLLFETEPAGDLPSLLSRIRCYPADGIVITAAAASQRMDAFPATDIPTVVLNRPVTARVCSAVYCDSAVASAAAADFLLEHGHRRLCVITANQSPFQEPHRLEGFCTRAQERGGGILEVVDADCCYESGYEAACQLLERQRPDAIFCLEDSVAMGVMDAARERFGLRVPEDLSVMGFGGADLGRLRPYSLTTVAHPTDAMLDAAAALLQAMIREPALRQTRIFDMELVVRKSVRL